MIWVNIILIILVIYLLYCCYTLRQRGAALHTWLVDLVESLEKQFAKCTCESEDTFPPEGPPPFP